MRTNTAPWDYQRRTPTPPDNLFSYCPACGYRFAVKYGEDVNCYKCETTSPLSASLEYRQHLLAAQIIADYTPPSEERIDEALNLLDNPVLPHTLKSKLYIPLTCPKCNAIGLRVMDTHGWLACDICCEWQGTECDVWADEYQPDDNYPIG